MKVTYEEIRDNNIVLRGMHHYPQHDGECPIIIVHGYFSANRIGPQRLFVNLANYLANEGYHVYRFDLEGMGESDGDISKVRFSGHVENLSKIIDAVYNKFHKNIIIIAHCLGCNITLSEVIDRPDIFREVIFLAPFYSNRLIMNRFFGRKKIRELSTKKCTYRKGLYADYSFFSENTQDDFKRKLSKTQSTINVIIPKNDQFIPFKCNFETFSRLNNINLIYIDKADHNFLETQNELLELVKRLLQDDKYTA